MYLGLYCSGLHLFLLECHHHLIPLLLERHSFLLHGLQFIQELVQLARLTLHHIINRVSQKCNYVRNKGQEKTTVSSLK